jgi:hypothetical protein
LRGRWLAGLILGLSLAACGTPPANYDVIAPDVYVGPERSCGDLGLSDVRCTAMVLRATTELEKARPGHAAVKSRSFHAVGQPPAGASVPPRTTEIPAIVVFALEDGKQVAVPIVCPRGGSTTDNACNPQVR